MSLRLVVATAICVLAAGAGCKKKAEDKGNVAGSTPVTPAAPGDLEQGGTAADPNAEGRQPAAGTAPAPEGLRAGGGGMAGEPAAAAGTVAPSGGSVGEPAAAPPAPPGDGPRALPCSWSSMDEMMYAQVATSPDPEAGDFTMDEAMAGLEGTGRPVATFDTTMGPVRCTLESERVPRGVANFIGLARGLRPWWDPCRKAWVKEPYYDGLLFHRVIPGFMAQGGDVLGNGMGGPGYEFNSEIVFELRHDRAGTLAYANSGPNTNGSQFYITVGPRPSLDDGYVVFGYCDNVGVIEQIVSVPRDGNDRPHNPVWLRSLTISREP